MPISEATYRQVALEDDASGWELICGRLWRKPPMTMRHDWLPSALGRQLVRRLPDEQWWITERARPRAQDASYLNPDLAVVPMSIVRRLATSPGQFQAIDEPAPFVLEAWSPSTGSYDVRTKLPIYQSRGDAEIWFVHPTERTLDIWRRRTGGYDHIRHTSGPATIASLPVVLIDFDALFLP